MEKEIRYEKIVRKGLKKEFIKLFSFYKDTNDFASLDQLLSVWTENNREFWKNHLDYTLRSLMVIYNNN